MTGREVLERGFCAMAVRPSVLGSIKSAPLWPPTSSVAHHTTAQPRVCGHALALLSASHSNLVPGTRIPPRRRARVRAAPRGFTSLGHENSAGPPATNQSNPEKIYPRRAHMCACSPAHPLCALVSLAAAFSRFRRRRRPETRTQQLLARHLGVLTGGARFGLAVCDGVKQAAASSCGCETAKLYRSIMHRLLQYIGR